MCKLTRAYIYSCHVRDSKSTFKTFRILFQLASDGQKGADPVFVVLLKESLRPIRRRASLLCHVDTKRKQPAQNDDDGGGDAEHTGTREGRRPRDHAQKQSDLPEQNGQLAC